VGLRLIRLSDELVQRCVEHCNAALRDLRDRRHPQVLAVSTHGAEENLPLWVKSKFAECIFALECNLDPRVAVRWSGGPDDGADVDVLGQRVDVKCTEMHYKYLIWPVGKNHIFDQKKFDVLALTKVDVYDCSGLTVGWISKARFREQCFVAPDGPGGDKLDPGTRYLPQENLDPLHTMRGGPAEHFEHLCFCGKWGSFGFGFDARAGKDAQWFCFEHKPNPMERRP
jgi:hypothetical protein